MKILFIHPNMPGQYKHLCQEFGKDDKNTVVFITKPRPHIDIPGVHKIEYLPPRDPSPSTHRYLVGFERAVLIGQEVWRICKKLKEEESFTPDIIVAHPGWGDCLYVKDIYPNTPLLSFFEFYYHPGGADVNFDPGDPSDDDDLARVRTKNATNLFNLTYSDWGISPTFWQTMVHPQEFHHKISVIHDGVDTETCVPDEHAEITLPDGTTLKKGQEIVTYVVRNFEPYRGFPTFMHAAEIILRERPNCHILAVGADGVSYGKRPPPGTTYRQQFMDKVKLDKKRIHWLGHVPYEEFLKVIQVSSAHIYLTYPFVLSWSAMESMSMEALVIGSDTPPVREVIQHGKNGLLVDFFDPENVASTVIEALDRQDEMQELRKNARKTILDRYALSKLLPLHVDLVRDIAKGQLPPPTAEKIKKVCGTTPPQDLLKAGESALQPLQQAS